MGSEMCIRDRHREDWGLEDPTGSSDEVFLQVIKTIEGKVLELKERVRKG